MVAAANTYMQSISATYITAGCCCYCHSMDLSLAVERGRLWPTSDNCIGVNVVLYGCSRRRFYATVFYEAHCFHTCCMIGSDTLLIGSSPRSVPGIDYSGVPSGSKSVAQLALPRTKRLVHESTRKPHRPAPCSPCSLRGDFHQSVVARLARLV